MAKGRSQNHAVSKGGDKPTTQQQPPQSSGRRNPEHQHLPEEREDPSKQGTPGEHTRASASVQGVRGGGGAKGAPADDVQEEATSGEPTRHTRHGGTKAPR